jgi:hypothetical protein
MQINIPKIVKPLDLVDYAPEMAGAVFQVWVNPPRKLLEDYDVLIMDAQKLIASMKDVTPTDAQKIAKDFEANAVQLQNWYSPIWSQGAEETRMTNEDVQALVKEMADTDPGLWTWLTGNTMRMIREHREAVKKK